MFLLYSLKLKATLVLSATHVSMYGWHIRVQSEFEPAYHNRVTPSIRAVPSSSSPVCIVFVAYPQSIMIRFLENMTHIFGLFFYSYLPLPQQTWTRIVLMIKLIQTGATPGPTFIKEMIHQC